MNELKKLAEAATPGPWQTWRDEATGAHVIWNKAGGQIGRLSPLWVDTAQYIAAASPATVLKLLELIQMRTNAAKAYCALDFWDGDRLMMQADEIERSLGD